MRDIELKNIQVISVGLMDYIIMRDHLTKGSADIIIFIKFDISHNILT